MNSHLLAADIISEVVEVKRGIMRELDYEKGLTLFKLMIVLLFIGILAGCSNPTGTNPGSSNATARKFEIAIKQWEAKQILQQIYKMEQAYHEKHAMYWPTFGTVSATVSNPHGLATLAVIIPPYSRYTYTITGTYTTFAAAATSTVLDDDATVDTWMIFETGRLVVTSDDAAD